MDKKLLGSIGIIIFFGIAFYFYNSIMSPSSISDKIKNCQKVMISGDNTNTESMRTFAKFDNTIQNSDYPVQFKREVSNCYVWLNDRSSDTRDNFINYTNEVFTNINTALNTVVTYDEQHNIKQPSN